MYTLKKKKNKKIAYVAMSADLIHPGHLNIINTAAKYGKVVVGLLTDQAIQTYKKKPFMNFQNRFLVVSALKKVFKVIPQLTHDYTANLLKIKPDFVVHGDDWKAGVQKNVRLDVLKVLKKWNGKLIEPAYTKSFSSTKLRKIFKKISKTSKIKSKYIKINH